MSIEATDIPGAIAHASIAAAPQKSLECTVGWIAHYTIGVVFALGLVVSWTPRNGWAQPLATMEDGMRATEAVPHTARLTGVAPQFLVDDLRAAIAYYRDKLGFGVDFCYDSFYAGVSRDGFAIHLKCAPKTLSDRTHRKQNEHLDAYLSVTGVAALHEELRSRGALITKSLETRPWSCIDFYVEDPDGYILCFSEPSA